MDTVAEALPFVAALSSQAADRRRQHQHRHRLKSDSSDLRSKALERPFPGTLGVFRHLIAAGSVPVWKSLGVVHQGWLTKRGGNFATWKRRWFVLRGDVIFYFREPDELKHLGEIPLAGNEVRRVENPDAKAPTKFLFEIVPGDGSEGFARDRSNYLLAASSQLEMEEWITKISHVILKEQRSMFKQTISETVSREVNIRHGGIVPLIVVQCCSFLNQYGLKEVGLFRQSGRVNRLKQFQDMYDRGQYPEFGSPVDTDIHTVASLLKQYLRTIPEAIIPQEYNDSFIAATRFYQDGSTSEAVQVLVGQLKALPQASYNTLKFICRFLAKVKEHAETNRMDASNLAVVFGPNLVRSQPIDDSAITDVRDMMKVVKDTGDMNVLTRILINEHAGLFPPVADESPIFQLQDYTTLCQETYATESPQGIGRSRTNSMLAPAAINPFHSRLNSDVSTASKSLLSFDSSSDEDVTTSQHYTSKVALSELSCLGAGPDSAVGSSDLTDLLGELGPCPPSARTGSAAASNGVQVRHVSMPPTNSGNRMAAFSGRLEEMMAEVTESRRLQADAQRQLRQETMAKKAWEKRYRDECKAKEDALERVGALERQVELLFNRHFPVEDSV